MRDRQTDCPYLALNVVISSLVIEKVIPCQAVGAAGAQPWVMHIIGDSPSGNHPKSQFTRLDSWPSLGGLYSPQLFEELHPSIQGAETHLHDGWLRPGHAAHE